MKSRRRCKQEKTTKSFSQRKTSRDGLRAINEHPLVLRASEII